MPVRPPVMRRVRSVTRPAVRFIAIISAALMLAGCATVVDGKLVASGPTDVPNANLHVTGALTTGFDVVAQNALSDIMAFWRVQFPKISGGKALTPLKGGLYSVDGRQVAITGKATGAATENRCIAKDARFIVDNGAFCRADDSIAWDRSPSHLFTQLADKYGKFMVALIFAHEFGHAISYRLGVFNKNVPTIDTESQADCAAGAWASSALKGQDPHFPDVTAQDLDDALEGYLNGRDSSAAPGDPQDASHGNGFDRLSALADGIDHGVTYCYSKAYFDRTFTERPYTSADDYGSGGNTPLSEVLSETAKNPFVTDLNRFWSAAAGTISKPFSPVSIAEAAHPPCSPTTTKFGYCPQNNTVYYDQNFASEVYNSLPAVTGDKRTGDVVLVENQPADFAVGVMLAIGWGMAVRHQLFNRSLSDEQALTAAVCYSGAYAKNVNVESGTPGREITLSPADLDEAVSSMIDEVSRPEAFGARDTTGLGRIQSFVKGYKGGLTVC